MDCTLRMEGEKPITVVCTVLAINHTNLCYRICSVCERTLPDNDPTSLCKFCNFNAFISVSSASKHLHPTNQFLVARVLFGCSADDFFNFAKLHLFTAVSASRILEGEMFKMTLSKPKNGNAQHLRVVTVIPLRTGF
ncbi:hypothetical protein RGQ29_001406 [Quercus rubra]|uniref:Uncharacterized protein n=1 Tax=Quercus rubra TaxID=3512 RepID=A0AAN7G719_QUERU|nr:hypothetical protein RGQ29_001406 [Quercus rubra]